MSSAASGILLIDKPEGPTSHDVVASVRRKLGTRKVGHAGTLDPDASGLLILCVGEATRLLEYLTAKDKRYVGTIAFGIGTDTHDAAGRVTVTADVSHLTDELVQDAVRQFVGTTAQTVPEYSAVHIDGQRAYELARAGKAVDMPQRQIQISRFDVGALRREGDVGIAAFDVICSKGTYIRALCRDLGAAVDVPAHMKELRRIAIGSVNICDAVDLETFVHSDQPHAYIREPLRFFEDFPRIEATLEMVERIANGQSVEVPPETIPSDIGQDGVAMLVYDKAVAAIVEVADERSSRVMRPKKVFWKRG
ncbi:tRNA pseudouridine(55) synthase TruB [Alicyclobacillus acidiphilus]|uniref:tRNA pseudouridine(55) synthase TruB n=1 Tax=Alicyclobacillus acidiphilus TaxID=182455 RepID=UPI00082F6CC7|nr:tRNA pseudouridine(55) synthase TruB [Alicyclobacillus acidiphilus]